MGWSYEKPGMTLGCTSPFNMVSKHVRVSGPAAQMQPQAQMLTGRSMF